VRDGDIVVMVELAQQTRDRRDLPVGKPGNRRQE
jgi:hypothetical protein